MRPIEKPVCHPMYGGLFEVSAERGFLPGRDPIHRLPEAFAAWEQIAGELPKLMVADRVRGAVEALPVLDAGACEREQELHRAMLLLSYIGHAYVWGGPPAESIPPGLAVPWHAVARRLGRPPVLSYASYALYNWRRIDVSGPIALGNIVLLQNFLGGLDEEWFILVHVEIEAKASAALQAVLRAQVAAADDRTEDLAASLLQIAAALQSMVATLARMTERCDPHIYFHRVRPYLYGWKDQPALPKGLVYQGVDEYHDEPQKFRGETGAQSAIVPTLDPALGISHASDPLRQYLNEMRQYMPPEHRRWIDAAERKAPVRPYVLQRSKSDPQLRDAYNQCVKGVEDFRSMHLGYAGRYIEQQSQRSAANPTQIGTGGTPFMTYLKKHRDETAGSLIDA